MLDYKLLEALAMVVESKGFERAAQTLHLTQSAVSQRIRSLEEQQGQVLLSRSTPPRPTDAGLRLLRHYRQVALLEQELQRNDAEQDFIPLRVGVNADSVSTWFMPVLGPLLQEQRIALEIIQADQDVTHRLVTNGEAAGCVSALDAPMRGCRMERLGCMEYGLFATPAFVARWFADGFDHENTSRAPLLAFDREDDLHNKLLRQVFGDSVPCPTYLYLPSAEAFLPTILSNLASGMLPLEEGRGEVEAGRLIRLFPDHVVAVDLYWHCWNIASPVLEAMTRCLVAGAGKYLRQDTA